MWLTIVIWNNKIIVSVKFAIILNNNTNNGNVTFKTNNNWIKHNINNRVKNFTKKSTYFENVSSYLNVLLIYIIIYIMYSFNVETIIILQRNKLQIY